MSVHVVSFNPLMDPSLYRCDACQRDRRPLFLARNGSGRALGFSCDTCLAMGRFDFHLAAA